MLSNLTSRYILKCIRMPYDTSVNISITDYHRYLDVLEEAILIFYLK